MKILLYILLLILPAPIFAQIINGTVRDEKGKPLDAATVTISQNGQVVNSLLVNSGKFILNNLNQLPYQLSVALIGYKPVLRIFQLPKDSLDVKLVNDNRQLEEVLIHYQKPTIERKIDRVVFNVENSIAASGGSAWEALARAPGVQTSEAGEVKASNKEAVVYVDGKPIRLSGDDLSNYLKSIPADIISKIEVMANPSAKYEAQGGAVINIISKKIKADGFNSNLSTGYTRGEGNRFTGAGIFNYRKNHLNVFGNYGYSDVDMIRKSDFYTIFETPLSFSNWQGKRVSEIRSKTSNYTAGADYNLSGNEVIGIWFTGNNASSFGNSKGIIDVFNNNKPVADSVQNTLSHSNGSGSQYSFNINYKVNFDTIGTKLNIDLDYVPFVKTNVSSLSNRSILADGNLSSSPYQIAFPSTQKINIWSGKADLEYSLGQVLKLESGIMYTSTVSENLFDFFNTASGIAILDSAKSDRFRYVENTAAAYTSISGQFGKWDLKGGLRTEYTGTKGTSLSLDAVNVRNYLRIFPTFFATYKASEDHELSLNYSKRIERPDYAQLNPARRYSSPYSYFSGNPFLRPALINDIQISYTLKQNYTLTGRYTQTDDLTSNVTTQDNVNKTYSDNLQNIGRMKETGLELSTAHHPYPWWETNNFATGSLRTQRSDQIGNSYNDRQLFCYLKTDQSFTIDQDGGWKAELGAWYQSALRQGVLRIASNYDLSMGMSKTLLKKQATIRLSASDILNGNAYTITTRNGGQNNGMYQQNDTRKVVIGFSYKFGSSSVAPRKRTTASEEERKRAN